MENITQNELYEILRNGDNHEKEKALAELQKRDSKKEENLRRSAAVAIITRNLSHGIGIVIFAQAR